MPKKIILAIVIFLNQLLAITVMRNPNQFPESYLTTNFPTLEQPDGITCGPTSATMLLNYYGFKTTLSEVKKVTKTHWFTYQSEAIGLTIPTYLDAALDAHGLHAKIETGTIRKLKWYVSKNQLPIVLVRSGQKTWHYIVVVGYDKGNIIIANPGSGTIYPISTKDFNAAWSFTGDLNGEHLGTDFYAEILKKVDLVNVTDHVMIVPHPPKEAKTPSHDCSLSP